jgi:5-methylcytosine-specific restriction endonuclease McrA
MHEKELRGWLSNNLGKSCTSVSDNWPAWLQVLGLHPRWGSRVHDITKARVVKSRVNAAMNLQIATSARWFTISWLACVRQPKATTNNLSVAMRSAIYYQIRQFRNLQKIKQCALCHAVTSLQVDHVIPLKVLILQYQEQTNIVTPTTFPYVRKTHAVTLPAGKYRQMWQQFHKKYAVLQLLCKPCNLHKAAS